MSLCAPMLGYLNRRLTEGLWMQCFTISFPETKLSLTVFHLIGEGHEVKPHTGRHFSPSTTRELAGKKKCI